MTMFLAPYTAIADIDGSPLDSGFLFFGEYGKDPELFPIEVFWDADFTVPAAQPIRTRNGYPVRNGSPTKVYLKTAQHSIVIKNRNSAFILVDFFNKGWDASFVVDASGLNQQEINGLTVTPFHFGAIGDGTSHKLSERYTTLSEAQAIYAHATSLDDEVDWCAVQKFLTFVTENTVPTANWSGNFVINKPLNRVADRPKTQTIYGCMRLFANASMKYMLRTAGAYCSYGDLFINGNNLAEYGWYNGDRVGSDSSICCTFGNTYITSCRRGGVFNGNETMFSTFKSLRVAYCGKKSNTPKVDFTFVSHNTGDQYVQQYSIISPAVMPDYDFDPLLTGGLPPAPMFVFISGKIYQVIGIDSVNNTLNIRPQLRPDVASGVLDYCFGAGFFSYGNNGSLVKIGQYSSIVCGIGLVPAGLFTMLVDQVTFEACGVGLCMGKDKQEVAGGFVSTKGYFEANTWDYVEISTVSSFNGITLPSNTTFTPSKSIYLGNYAWVNSSGVASQSNLSAAKVNIGAEIYDSYIHTPAGGINLSSNEKLIRRYSNSGAFALSFDTNISRLFNTNYVLLEVIGTGRNGSPTGTITLTPPSGYTINNAESLVINSQNIGKIQVSLLVLGTNIVASVLNNLDKIVTVTYDPPSLAAGGISPIQTITLTGAVLGDAVSASFSQNLNGCEIIAYVSAANTVSYYFKNNSAATVDLPSGTVKVKII